LITVEEEIDINKKTSYLSLINAIENLLETEHNELSILANCAALIKTFVKNINWAGFYLLKNELLILGPFQGKLACNPIRVGSGVCGKCVEARATIVVGNVHEFEGHIPCDEATNSEIVIPIFIDDEIYGVLDLDSKMFNRFSTVDRRFLEQITVIIARGVKMAKEKNPDACLV
jgi:GAF domain-containing protein